MSRIVVIPNLNDLIQRYEAGESLKHLSDETGIGRGPLLAKFLKHGVNVRGQSDAERLKWSRMTDTQRAAQTAAAHAAVLGTKRPRIELIRRARRKMRQLAHVGKFEREIATILRERGYDVIQQFAIQRYNVDLALTSDRIAVEILLTKTGWVAKSTGLERTKYLLNRGWHVLIVFVESARQAADDIIAFAEFVRREHPTRRQYRVIGRDAQRFLLLRSHGDHTARIKKPYRYQKRT